MRLFRLTPLSVALWCGCAEARPPEAPTSQAAPVSHENARARALATLATADLCKPREMGAPQQSHQLAPLIIEERAEEASSQAPSIKEVCRTVYVTTRNAQLHGRELPQLTYRWICRARTTTAHGPIHDADWRGVRLTLDERGFPLVYEVLGSNLREAPVYVSRSLERAASEEYGEPLPGRASAAERSLDETPDVLVVRVLEDGPVPMGPMVYVSDPGQTLASIACRCMPSQMTTIRENGSYHLMEPDAEYRTRVAPVFADDPDRDDPSRLERILRWPHGI